MQKVRLICPAQRALPKPPLGPVIGQLQLPIDKVCNAINLKTKHYTPESPIRISIKKYSRNEYYIEEHGPDVVHLMKTVSFLLNHSSSKKKELRYITCSQVFIIVSQITENVHRQQVIYKSILNGLLTSNLMLVIDK